MIIIVKGGIKKIIILFLKVFCVLFFFAFILPKIIGFIINYLPIYEYKPKGDYIRRVRDVFYTTKIRVKGFNINMWNCSIK